MSICIEVWGDYACFTRPELKTERVSYEVMTPSAARGILEAIYWHPGMVWRIDTIRVCNPIRFTNIRRNEVKSTLLASSVKPVIKESKGKPLYLAASQDRCQRAAMILRDVHYIIEAHFDMTDRAAVGDNPGKFQDIIKRRIHRGQCYHTPYFGCREFPVRFAMCEQVPECPAELLGNYNLGYMLWDMDYSNPKDIHPLFFHAKLANGVMTVPSSKEVQG